jgi:hypothetical protein
MTALWMALWKVCLVAGISAFVVMAVLVTFGGAFDIRRLLKSLRDD